MILAYGQGKGEVLFVSLSAAIFPWLKRTWIRPEANVLFSGLRLEICIFLASIVLFVMPGGALAEQFLSVIETLWGNNVCYNTTIAVCSMDV